jgi:dienelactone hydrolase
MRLALIACAAICFPTAVSAAPRLTGPADLADPRPAPVRISGLVADTEVTVTTTRRERDETFEASATFRSDARGRLDTAVTAPLFGSYRGVDPLALFWSATPRHPSDNDPVAGSVRVVVRSSDRILATLVIRSRPDTATIVVSTDTPFPGAVFARPADAGRHPVIIVLGGSEGGSSTAKALAPLFTARGYATLGLPYYDPGYDPSDRLAQMPASFSNIPVDRLVMVRDWLAHQPSADVNRIGIWGASKGAEFALIAATRYSWIKAVAAIVPSDLVWEGWGQNGPATASFSFAGRSLPFQPYSGMAAELAKAAKGQPMDLRRVHLAGRASFPDRIPAARIPIERYRGALLVAGSGADAIWPSAEMATNIAATRRQARLATTLLNFPDAGHLIGGPGTSPGVELTGAGGTAAAIAHARIATWRATFDLFGTVLTP